MSEKPEQMLGLDDEGPPPYEFEIDPALDLEVKRQEAEAALAASAAEAQQQKDEAATLIAENNDPAEKALEALRSGEPLQDEPI